MDAGIREDRAAAEARLRRVALTYLVPATAWGALGIAGAHALTEDGVVFGVPWLVAGVGAVMGTAAIVLAALRARAAISVEAARTVRLARAVVLAHYARLTMLLCAAATVAASLLVTPTSDDERGFVLGVNAAIALTLAMFALLADGVRRAVGR